MTNTTSKDDGLRDELAGILDSIYGNYGIALGAADRLMPYIKRNREQYGIQERIDERAKYRSLLENVIDVFPRDNDWARGRVQGIKDCIADQNERITELTALKDKQELRR